MQIYVAVPTEIEDITDPLSEMIFGGTIKEIIAHCKQFWDEMGLELENIKTKADLSGDTLFIDIEGDDPEVLYIETGNDGHYTRQIEYKIKVVDTKIGW